MQEICLPGSEGGAKLSFVPTPIRLGGPRKTRKDAKESFEVFALFSVFSGLLIQWQVSRV